MDASMVANGLKVRRGKSANADGKSIKDVIIDRLTSEKFFTTEVTGGSSGAPRDFAVAGTLSEFIACARQLDITVLFIGSESLEEDDFFYSVEPMRGIQLEDDERYDLREIESRLTDFVQYIDSPRLVVVTGCFEGHSISYKEEASWCSEFEDLREGAIEKVVASSQEEEEQREREEEEREERVVGLIRLLRDNQDFRTTFLHSRPTQGAIIAYVRTKIEGAEELSNRTLRYEANLLRDSILLAKQ